MKANYKDKINKAESNMSLGTLYEVNQQLMMKEPAMAEEKIQFAKEQMREWFTHNFTEKYFMLLCHELRDYTLFNLDKTNTWKMANPMCVFQVANDIIECMTNRGELLSMELQEDGAWEIWIRNTENCFVYYLFPYGAAVLEY